MSLTRVQCVPDWGKAHPESVLLERSVVIWLSVNRTGFQHRVHCTLRCRCLQGILLDLQFWPRSPTLIHAFRCTTHIEAHAQYASPML
jgi:hypothetical protein